jgi:hypothetical protein
MFFGQRAAKTRGGQRDGINSVTAAMQCYDYRGGVEPAEEGICGCSILEVLHDHAE